MFMFIQTVSVVRRNFIPWRGGEGGETIIKSKLARKRRTRTMGQGIVATPPRRVSDDTRRRRRRRRGARRRDHERGVLEFVARKRRLGN